MTVINVVPAVAALASGSSATAGMFSAIPWRGTSPAVVTAGASVVFPQPISVPVTITGPVVPIDLIPGDGTWCWAVTITVGTQAVTRYVQVPASGPVNWGALVDVDPTSFVPVTPTAVAGWDVAYTAATTALAAAQAVGNTNDTIMAGVASDGGSAFSAQLSAKLEGLFDPNDVGYDVILCLGESNASSRAGAPDPLVDPTDPRVFQYGTNTSFGAVAPGELQLPRPAYTDSISIANTLNSADGGKSYLTYFVGMARDYLRSVPANRKVLLVPLGFGGTSMSPHWVAGQPMFNLTVMQATKALAAAGPNSRIAEVWMQEGLNDASSPGATFRPKLDGFIDDLRSALGIADLAFVFSGVPMFSAATYGPEINDVLLDTPRRKVRTGFHYGPLSAPGDLTYDNLDGSHNHYNSLGQRFLAAGGVFASVVARANVFGVKPVAPISAPSGVQTGTTLAVGWPASVGRATDYLLEYRRGAGAWTPVARPKPLDVRQQEITGLTKGSTYEVRVSTVNEEGTSVPSPSLAFPMLTDPAAPVATVGTPTAGTIPLTWAAAARAATYRIEYRLDGASTWLSGVTSSPLSGIVTGLSAGTAYEVRVVAINAAGETGSAAAAVTTLALDILYDALSSSGKAGAWALWSISRRLNDTYTGALIRVRRSSDSTEQDIPQTAGKTLDEAALLSFVGAGDGYITKVYHQAFGADLAQANTANQPQIVLGGVIHKVNGRPAALQTSTQLLENTTPGLWAAGSATIYAAIRATVGGTAVLSETASGGNPRYFPLSIGTGGNTMARTIINDAGVTLTSANTATQKAVNAGYHCVGVQDTGTATVIRQDGALVESLAYTRSGTITPTRLAVMGDHRSGVVGATGYWSEVVAFSAVLSDADCAAIEASMATWYATAA